MLQEEVIALRRASGVFARPELFTIAVRGPDRERYLNGMLSNDVSLLSPGQGQWAVKANNKGRVEGVIRVRRDAEQFLLDVREVVAERVATQLMALIVMDDCQLVDLTPERDVVAVVGPTTREVLEEAGFGPVPELSDLASALVGEHTLVRDDWLGVPGYEVHGPAGSGASMMSALREAGACEVSAGSVDVVRVEAGVPIDGPDIDDDTIPMEAKLQHALNFEKGCYIGQETIARATNLGGVRHHLVGLMLDGPVSSVEGQTLGLYSGAKRTGELTSVVDSPTVGGVIGLGYVHESDDMVGNILDVGGQGGKPAATIVPLPFVS